jgi:thymidylate kinase
MKPDCDQERHRLALEPLSLPRFADRDVSRPFVVALEGANGAGKSTLCHLLARTFAATACLGSDEACEQMRVLRSRPNPLVIMDRSLWSTLAVHGAENPKRLETLLTMLRPVAAQIHVPDLTLVLETDFETCQSRIARKSGVARLLDDLTATPAFHAREREFYRWLARQSTEVRILDTNQAGPEAVAKQAAAIIRDRAGARNLALPDGGNDKTSGGAAS